MAGTMNDKVLAVSLVILAGASIMYGMTLNENGFPDLKQSDMLRGKALLRWLMFNRTENGSVTFPAGFIRLAFHDCFSGCDGCLNLNNPANGGLTFYKRPLDMMYADYMTEVMSRADWYALAAVTAVEVAAELSDECEGEGCIPVFKFQFGRIDCVDEMLEFREFPPPMEDPRTKIRKDFNMTLYEITALMGAHTMGRHHGQNKQWVEKHAQLNNQYYKDMLDPSLKWTWEGQVGLRAWVHGRTKQNLMLQSDMFMAFDVANPKRCSPNPIAKCNQSLTYAMVYEFAQDNKLWLQTFADAYTTMLRNTKPHVNILKDVVMDTEDTEFSGDVDEVLAFEDLPEEDWSDFKLPEPVLGIDEINNEMFDQGVKPVQARRPPPTNPTVGPTTKSTTSAQEETTLKARTISAPTATPRAGQSLQDLRSRLRGNRS